MVSQKLKRYSVPGQRLFYGYFIVLAAFFIMLVTWGVYYAFGVFFKPVLNELGWSRAMTSGAFSFATIMSGLFGIVMGGLTDKLGSRMVMTVCGLLLGLGYILMSQINAAWQLYLFYGVIVGTGMGGSFVPLMSTVARWFVEKRSMMTGIVTAGIGIGALIGPPVASWLISGYGWRVSYTILGSVVSVVVVICSQVLKRDPSRVDLVAYGAHSEEKMVFGSEEVALGKAIYTGQFWMVFVIFFCIGFCVLTIMVHIAPHTSELGMSAAGSARVLATIGGLSIVGKILLGRAADTIGSRKTLVVSFFLMSVALLYLLAAKRVWAFYSFACIFGLAYGGCVISESPLVAMLYGLASHGLIFGILAFNVTIGGAFGPLLTGYIFDVTNSYQLAFLICAAVSTVGLILAGVLKPRGIKGLRG